MKIERLLGIIIYMLNRESVNAPQLAERFNVSRRTIIRDIDTLTLAGIPIYSEIGSKGGYSINRDYRLNEKIINKTDSDYMLLALQSLKTIYGDERVEETYEKIKHLYLNETTEFPLDINFSVLNENEFVNSIIPILKNALNESKTITFQYTNINGRKRNVSLNIIKILYKWYSWYVFGYDINKNDYRLFKLSRMRNLVISNEHFVEKYDFTNLLDDYEKKTRNSKECIFIKYSQNISPLIDEYFQGEVIKNTKNHVIKEIIIGESDFMMFSIILGFGDKIEVLSPDSYRNKIINHLKQTLAKNYNNSDI